MIPGRPVLPFESELFSFSCSSSFSAIIKLPTLLEGEVESLAAAAKRAPIDPLFVEDDPSTVCPLLAEVISPKVLRKFSRSSNNDLELLLLIKANGLPGTRIGDFGAEDNLNGDFGAEESANEIGCD